MGWVIVFSDEVERWYARLEGKDFRIVYALLEMLASRGYELPMPHSRPLGEGLYELRFKLSEGRVTQRVTYIFEPVRHIITLTTFPKQQMNEKKQILRARKAQKVRRQERSGS
jgi:hypothetical protein